jgi:hypothetical protein
MIIEPTILGVMVLGDAFLPPLIWRLLCFIDEILMIPFEAIDIEIKLYN